MSEYKLSITAKEIDERLGQIPQLALDIENLKQNGGVVVGGSVDYSESIYENGFVDICTLTTPITNRLDQYFIEDNNPDTLLEIGKMYKCTQPNGGIKYYKCFVGVSGQPALGEIDAYTHLEPKFDSVGWGYYIERFPHGWLIRCINQSSAQLQVTIAKLNAEYIDNSNFAFMKDYGSTDGIGLGAGDFVNTGMMTNDGKYLYANDNYYTDPTDWMSKDRVDKNYFTSDCVLKYGDKNILTQYSDFRNTNVYLPFGGKERIFIGIGNMSLLGCGPDTGEPACKVIIEKILPTSAIYSHQTRYAMVTIIADESNVEQIEKSVYFSEIHHDYRIDKDYLHIDYNDIENIPAHRKADLVPLQFALGYVTEYYEEYDSYGITEDKKFEMKPGYTYIVGWNDRNYLCSAFSIDNFIPGAVALGNLSRYDLPHNNEPFLLVQKSNCLDILAVDEEDLNHNLFLIGVGIFKRGVTTKTLPPLLSGVVKTDLQPTKTIVDKTFRFDQESLDNAIIYSPIAVYNDNPENPIDFKGEQAVLTNILDSLIEGKYYKIIWQQAEYICQATKITLDFGTTGISISHVNAFEYFGIGNISKLIDLDISLPGFNQTHLDGKEFPFCLCRRAAIENDVIRDKYDFWEFYNPDPGPEPVNYQYLFDDTLQIYELEDPKIDPKYLDLGDINLNLDILTDGDEAIEEVILPMTEIMAKGDSIIDPSEPPVLQQYVYGNVFNSYVPAESQAVVANLPDKFEFGTTYTITLNGATYKCKYEDVTALVRAGFTSPDPEEMAMVDYIYGGILSPSDFTSAITGGLADGDFGYICVWLDMPDYDYVETLMSAFMFGVTSHGEDIPMQIGISKVTPGGQQHVKYEYLDFIAGGGEEIVELFPLQTIHVALDSYGTDGTGTYTALLNGVKMPTIGQMYEVSFRGSKYTCTAKDITQILLMNGGADVPADTQAILLGNFFAGMDMSSIQADELAFFERLGITNTGEPFAVEIVNAPSMGLQIGLLGFTDTFNENGIDIEFGITGAATSKPYIKHEFLDFMNAGGEGYEGQVISPKLTNTLYQENSNENGYFYMGTMMGTGSSLPVAGNLEPDMKCKVNIEGQESVIVQAKDVTDLAMILMPGMTFTKAVAIGNMALFSEVEPAMGELITVENTGEDWGFGVFQGTDEDGTNGWGLMIIVRTPTDEGSSIEFTASVTEWVEGGQFKIKEEFLPDITWNSIAGYKLILPETTLTLESDDDAFELNNVEDLVIGETYNVIIDGITYEMQCMMFEIFPAVWTEGAPYAFVQDKGGLILGYPSWLVLVQESPYPTPENPRTITVSISQGTPNKVPSYLLPSSSTGLPEVSSADAGKFLRVNTNGDWVAMAIPNAEEVSF